ncbi:MAG TPA: hypothetical protein VKB88_28755, partial [Bryobacteraceae bacterium]|nr:hypothetical protein [Bryobacteraceae bacterium]
KRARKSVEGEELAPRERQGDELSDKTQPKVLQVIDHQSTSVNGFVAPSGASCRYQLNMFANT